MASSLETLTGACSADKTTTRAPVPHASDFSSASLTKFRNDVFAVFEEHQMMKAVEAENDAQFKKLLEKQRQLNNQVEEANCSLTKSEQSKAETVENLRKQHHTQVKDLQQNNFKLTDLNKKCELEMKSLKDEVTQLQLEKLNLEKKLRERDLKISRYSEGSRSIRSQILDLHTSLQKIQQQSDNYVANQERLSLNVLEVKKINEKLTRLDLHHKSEICQHKKRVKELQEELGRLRIRKDAQQPLQESQVEEALTFEKFRVGQLEQELTKKNASLQEWKEKSNNLKDEIKSERLLLKEAHDLIKRLQAQKKDAVEDVDTFREQAEKIKLELTDQLLLTKDKLHEKQLEHETANEQLMLQNKELKLSFDKLKTESEEMQIKLSSFEEINVKHEVLNQSLNNELSTLKETINKQTVDVEVQVSSQKSDACEQVEPSINDIDTQTITNASSTSETQTERGSSDEKETQTLDGFPSTEQSDVTDAELGVTPNNASQEIGEASLQAQDFSPRSPEIDPQPDSIPESPEHIQKPSFSAFASKESNLSPKSRFEARLSNLVNSVQEEAPLESPVPSPVTPVPPLRPSADPSPFRFLFETRKRVQPQSPQLKKRPLSMLILETPPKSNESPPKSILQSTLRSPAAKIAKKQVQFVSPIRPCEKDN